MTARSSNSRLRVNPIACKAHGVCIELLPELIGSDPWGYPVVSAHPVPPRLMEHAKRAIEACPTIALLLEAAPQAPTPTSRKS